MKIMPENNINTMVLPLRQTESVTNGNCICLVRRALIITQKLNMSLNLPCTLLLQFMSLIGRIAATAAANGVDAGLVASQLCCAVDHFVG